MAIKKTNITCQDDPLTTLNGIKFTNREIDIITLIFHTRGSSKIAYLLSISTRTVETHTANIMRKIDTNSREGIIDFVEKSGHVSWINKHYRNISIEIDFKKKLQEISRQISKRSFVCSLIFEPDQERDAHFASTLKDHLSLCGIIVISSSNDPKLINHSQQQESAPLINHTLYVVPKKEIDNLRIHKDEFLSNISSLTGKNISRLNVTFLLNDLKNRIVPENFRGDESFITFTKEEDYCISFLKVLKKMLPEVISDDVIADFKNKCDSEYNYPKTSSSPFKFDLSQLKHKGLILKNKIVLCIVAPFFILACVTGVLVIKGNKFNPNNQNETKLTHPIRSDLIIPKGNTFLDRPHITNQIAKSLKDNQGIQTVALVGIGGAGKTTLARNYALQQNANIVWEINAATRESLRDSLEHLAYALCKSEEEKTILMRLQSIKNSLEKDQKILLFVKERMKKISNWFLIYDNVEKFADIYKFFPCDPNVWGNGKIIITTNNSNTKNNSFINSFVQIGELSPQQKLDLFMKIMDEESFQRFTLDQKEKTNTFLNDVPPYPLDISIAAYYLKSTNTPYEQYLKMLKENRKDFDIIQADVLKEASGYTKTRYGIITLSIKELITIHKDFQDLLLLISLIGYQNIPKSFLIQYKGDTITDNFIYHLKKYSLVTNESFSGAIPTISIHRKTQEIILSYLTNTLTLSSESPLLNSVATMVEDYILDAVDKEDFLRMKLLVPHGETLLTRDDLLSNATKNSLKGALGCIYYYLRYYPKIKQYLEENIADLKQHYGEKHDKIARILFYLGNLYRSLGDYERAKILLEQSLAICKENPNYLRRAKAGHLE
jgi:DNA-binding CsgD family transcriptional regulator